MKNKIITAVLSLILLINLAGCTNQGKTKPIEPNTPNQTVSANSSSGADVSDNIADESSPASELETEPPAESEKEPAEEKIPVSQPSASSAEKPAETKAPKPAEPSKQPEETSAVESKEPTVPTQTENPTITEQPPQATAADSKLIADKIIQYINSYRSAPATKLPGLTAYAEYRSRQIISNFAHDTDDQRAAATALQYGEYVDPSLYGMTGEPYYTVNAREAIAKAGYRGTADYVAEQLALQFKNSASHWSYISDTKYQYIAVGVTYQNGTWHCAVVLSRINTDNN